MSSMELDAIFAVSRQDFAERTLKFKKGDLVFVAEAIPPPALKKASRQPFVFLKSKDGDLGPNESKPYKYYPESKRYVWLAADKNIV